MPKSRVKQLLQVPKDKKCEEDTYYMAHIHTGPPGICRCQDTGQGTHPDQPPLHTEYDCCICMKRHLEKDRC